MDKNMTVIIVCVVYFVMMVLIGVIAARKNRATSDYLVAGRKLNVTMTAITLAAVQIGVGIVLSSATNGYNDGVWPGMYYAFGCGGGLIWIIFHSATGRAGVSVFGPGSAMCRVFSEYLSRSFWRRAEFCPVSDYLLRRVWC